MQNNEEHIILKYFCIFSVFWMHPTGVSAFEITLKNLGIHSRISISTVDLGQS